MTKRILILFTVLLLTVFFSEFVRGFEIHTNTNSHIIIDDVEGNHIISSDGDLNSKIFMSFNVESEYTEKNKNITIFFTPWERSDTAPIENISISICTRPDIYGFNYDVGYVGKCNSSYDYVLNTYERERVFIDEGVPYLKNYTEYRVTFFPQHKERWQGFIFLINYTMPNFIFKQGDYSVAWLRTVNMDNKPFEIKNSLILPSKDDIPRFIPDAKESKRDAYFEGNKLFYRWIFIFQNKKDNVIWYWNNKEIQQKEEELQDKYTTKGVWKGVGYSLLVAIIIIVLERLLFDWLPLGNRLLAWLINKTRPRTVIANYSNKIYHKPGCVFIDNIAERNRRVYKKSELAEQEGYRCCRTCNTH